MIFIVIPMYIDPPTKAHNPASKFVGGPVRGLEDPYRHLAAPGVGLSGC